MTFQKIHKRSSSSLPVRRDGSSLALRCSAIQARLTPDQSTSLLHPEPDAPLEPSRGFGHTLANIPVSLPHHLKTGVERLSGLSMDDVKVHYNSAAPGRLRAHAYAMGSDIHVGAGRERDLPHEAWHVVQQKQGRVAPTAGHAAGAAINDDPGLEREADRMGEAASRANGDEQGPRDHHVRASARLQRGVVQRKKAQTNFGEFETKNFADAGNSGVDIVLTFTPDKAKVDATKIALTQSVKANNEAGTAYAVSPTMANRMVPAGQSGEGYTIDASGATNNPLYFDTKNLGQAEQLKDTPAGAATLGRLGQDAQYMFGSCFKEHATDAERTARPAALHDRPQGIKKQGAGMTFETAAMAIDGRDKGKYYGSVKWGYTISGIPATPVTKADIETAGAGTPTANFIEAAKLFNAGKTRGTLIVNPTAPGNNTDAYVQNVSGPTTPRRLAAGTKLKQLDIIKGSSESMINAEVLNADGTGTGRIVNIYVADVKDIGDGAANKALPEQ